MSHFSFPSPAQQHPLLRTNPPSDASSCQAIPISSQLRGPFLSSLSPAQPQALPSSLTQLHASQRTPKPPPSPPPRRSRQLLTPLANSSVKLWPAPPAVPGPDGPPGLPPQSQAPARLPTGTGIGGGGEGAPAAARPPHPGSPRRCRRRRWSGGGRRGRTRCRPAAGTGGEGGRGQGPAGPTARCGPRGAGLTSRTAGMSSSSPKT